MSCCNNTLYDEAFDAKFAQNELEEYLTSGLKKSSRPFLEALQSLPLEEKTLLDIGGGIGAVTFELFGQGIRYATHIDISAAYVETFRTEAERLLLIGNVQSLHGDFQQLQGQIPPADLVILDKVICCYKDYEKLVGTSVAKASRWYVFSIPRNVWWVRIVHFFKVVMDRLKGRYFPIFYHPVKGIEQIITATGFQRKEVKIQREWRIAVFEKAASELNP